MVGFAKLSSFHIAGAPDVKREGMITAEIYDVFRRAGIFENWAEEQTKSLARGSRRKSLR